MPYPNEHSCRLKDPGQYDRFNRETCGQKHEGKCIDVIYGIKAGKSEVQALRYKKDVWTEASARSHCSSREGSFEAASDSKAGKTGMNRAYSIFEVKAFDEEKRILTGIATTPTPDRIGDIIEPKGVKFKLPLPFLWQHKHDDPIGWVQKAQVRDNGIEIEAKIADYDEPGELKNRLVKAWHMIKSGLVKGLSIGFREIESAEIRETNGYRYLKWEWIELSAVTIPANVDATITAIKSASQDEMSAASGQTMKPPGVSGIKKEKERDMKTLQEQLMEFKEAKRMKFGRIRELADIVKNENREWTDDERQEFDSLEVELKQLDGDIRQKTVEIMNSDSAAPILPEAAKRSSSSSRGLIVHIPKDKDESFQGQNFTRMIIAKALAHMEGSHPGVIAERRWGRTNPTLVEIIKADISGGTSTTSHWASELVQADTRYTGDFIEFLKKATVFDRLPLRVVPANVTIKGRDGAATGYWVGEGRAIPATEMTFMDVSLTPLKVAALAVITNELIRDSSPSAEQLVRDALVDASAQRVDTTFLGTGAASAGVSPAGLLNAVVAITSNGEDGTALRADVRDLYAPFIAAQNASGLYMVMNPALAKSIQLLSNALGIQEFPTINQNGGTLLGDPVVTGDNVAADDFILLKPSDIYRIGDTGVEISVSREAMIEMADNPAHEVVTPTGPTGKIVSMFQTESTAIKIVRSINYQKRRTGVVQFIDSATYGGAESP